MSCRSSHVYYHLVFDIFLFFPLFFKHIRCARPTRATRCRSLYVYYYCLVFHNVYYYHLVFDIFSFFPYISGARRLPEQHGADPCLCIVVWYFIIYIIIIWYLIYMYIIFLSLLYIFFFFIIYIFQYIYIYIYISGARRPPEQHGANPCMYIIIWYLILFSFFSYIFFFPHISGARRLYQSNTVQIHICHIIIHICHIIIHICHIIIHQIPNNNMPLPEQHGADRRRGAHLQQFPRHILFIFFPIYIHI